MINQATLDFKGINYGQGPGPSGWDVKKIIQVALPIFALIALTAAALYTGSSILGAICFAYAGVIAIGLAVSALWIFFRSSGKETDYQEKNLIQIREEAKSLPFNRLCQKHGLKNLVEFIFPQEAGREELREKFKVWAKQEPAVRLALFCPLQQLEELQIAPAPLAKLVGELHEETKEAQRAYGQELATLNSLYIERTNRVIDFTRNLGGPYKAIGNILQFAPESYTAVQYEAQVAYDDALKSCRQVLDKTNLEIQAKYQASYEACFTESEKLIELAE